RAIFSEWDAGPPLAFTGLSRLLPLRGVAEQPFSSFSGSSPQATPRGVGSVHTTSARSDCQHWVRPTIFWTKSVFTSRVRLHPQASLAGILPSEASADEEDRLITLPSLCRTDHARISSDGKHAHNVTQKFG